MNDEVWCVVMMKNKTCTSYILLLISYYFFKVLIREFHASLAQKRTREAAFHYQNHLDLVQCRLQLRVLQNSTQLTPRRRCPLRLENLAES